MTTKHASECDRAAVKKKTHNGVRWLSPPHPRPALAQLIMHIDDMRCSLGFSSLFIVVR